MIVLVTGVRGRGKYNDGGRNSRDGNENEVVVEVQVEKMVVGMEMEMGCDDDFNFYFFSNSLFWNFFNINIGSRASTFSIRTFTRI